jgi:protein SCO1/2
VNRAILSDVKFEQRLDVPLNLDLPFRDERAHEHPLRSWFGNRPVVLALVYYRCPMLCNQVVSGLVTALRAIELSAGRDFDVVLVSIDHREGPDLAMQKKSAVLREYDRPQSETGWHFLTGSEESIAELASQVGYEFRYDSKSRQFAHASGLIVLTPEGRTARYFYGIDYPTRDLRWALVEASHNRIGSAVDQLLLFCYHFDPATGRYGVAIMRLLRAAGATTVLCLVGYIVWACRRDCRPGCARRG